MNINYKYIRNIFKSILIYLIRLVGNLLWKIALASPKVIVYMDGGICSQMKQYVVGQIFVKNGYEVKYDIDWFDKKGIDNDGKFVRNFDLLKSFNLLFISSNVFINVCYKIAYIYKGNHLIPDDFSFMRKCPPIYLGGYYELPDYIWKSDFSSYFDFLTINIDKRTEEVLNEIDECDVSCAVHVRRGDLKLFNPYYGAPATVNYFVTAIKNLANRYDNVSFFFFSDEPHWVQVEIYPFLSEYNCTICDMNGYEKGYLDLMCISRCNHQIASIGSFGKFGSLLNSNPDKILFLRNDPAEYVWKNRHPNVIIIEE